MVDAANGCSSCLHHESTGRGARRGAEMDRVQTGGVCREARGCIKLYRKRYRAVTDLPSVRTYRVRGKSTAGFRAKKSKGRNSNSCHAVGMIGQSSGRGTWWKPIVYHTTMSVFSIGRLAL